MAAVEILTFGDLLTDFAEKIGETSQNTDDNRKRKTNNALNQVHGEDLWWFDEVSDATQTTTLSTYTYALPTGYRVPHPDNPVKIGDNWYVMVPFSDLQQYQNSSGVVQLPQFKTKKRAYIYGGNMTFLTSSMAAGLTITHYFYKAPTTLDALGDIPRLPAQYLEAVSLLAAGNHLKSQGGREAVEANDYLELYENYLKIMRKENDMRRNWGVARRSRDPEEQAVISR